MPPGNPGQPPKPPKLRRVDIGGTTFIKENVSRVESIEKIIGKNRVYIHLKTGERILVDEARDRVLSLIR